MTYHSRPSATRPKVRNCVLSDAVVVALAHIGFAPENARLFCDLFN